MYGITELKEQYTCRVPGFNVRLGWKDNKPAINVEFGNKAWGGKEKALKAAIKYRDAEVEKMKQAGKWPVDHHRIKPGVRNKSGVVGVRRARQYGLIGGGKKGPLQCFAWQASWWIDGKMKSASFGETKWGAENAFQMACDCREARENIYAGSYSK